MKSTCFECDKRHPACHDHCEVYQAAKREVDEARERQRKEEAIDTAIIKAKTKIADRERKRRRR